MEVSLGKTNLFCNLYVNHLKIQGSPVITQIFDISYYPKTISSQDYYNFRLNKGNTWFRKNSSLYLNKKIINPINY